MILSGKDLGSWIITDCGLQYTVLLLIAIPVVLKRAEKVGFDNPEQQTKDFKPTTNKHK
jgi:hypothetical protein